MDKNLLKMNKAESEVLMAAIIAIVISVFCLAASWQLLGKAIYQAKVIGARKSSAKQMTQDVTSANNLVTQYNKVFIGASPTNIIGGSNDSNPAAAPPNGNNGKIVLDALPTVYDFPALLTSVSKILSNDSITNPSIGGTDQSSAINSTASGRPQVGAIDLAVSGTGAYGDVQRFITDLERSIRPFDVTHLTLTGNQSNVTTDLSMTTYYQPAKTLNITDKEIK